jgi:Tfp pilus assembly protein PilF
LRQTRFPVSNLSAIIYSTVTEKPHGSEFAVLADVFMEATDYDAARLAISRALQLQPEDGFALNLAGLVELRSGHCEAALQYFSRSLASGRRDGWPQYNTALCQERLGHLGDAESSYTAAISEQVKPQSQGDRAQFLNGYAWFLVTHFGNNRTKLTVAKTYAQEAVNITRERDSNILDTLAAIRFATGDRLGAVTLETKALEIAQADNKDVTAIARNLEKYRAH